ncbi:MAG: hypothetical protein ACK2UK_19130, partial [Candidatus Promineifilaceae bacterium]
MDEEGQWRIISKAERPELAELFYPQKERIWAPFMFEDVIANQLWHYVSDIFTDYQQYLVDENNM